MTNANDVRNAHHILDELDARAELSQAQEKLLRSFLPERPKQKTLTEITQDVYRAWYETLSSHWKAGKLGNLEAWLLELHENLQKLEDTSIVSPALPDGMRLADHEEYGRVVVSPGVGVDTCHEIFYLEPGMKFATGISEVEPDSLTFIDAKPAHPEFLETEADYENAPVGTIAACDDSPSWHKRDSLWQSVISYGHQNAKYMSGIRRRVLRWGK